jgi:hypothetical protein
MFALLVLVTSLVVLVQPSIEVNNGVPSIFNGSGAQSTLAPNVVFVIYGHNLGPSSMVVAPPPNYPPSLAGTSISFTPAAGGTAIPAFMYYSLENAVTGVLPLSAMAKLQPAAATGTSFGGITVTANPNPGMFNATLRAGGQLDFGSFGSTVGVTKNIGVQ